MKAFLLSSLILMGGSTAKERRVLLDEATIKSTECGAEAKLTWKEDESLGLTVLMNGKPVVIPERALADIKKPSVGSARFFTTTPTGVPVSEAKLTGGLILIFHYGNKVYRPKSEETQSSACRITISPQGKFQGLETAVPEGYHFYGKWQIVHRSETGLELRKKTTESQECPLTWRK